MADIDAQARRLYEASTRSAPTWDQLGDTTKGVWREQIQKQGADTARPAAPAAEDQQELF
ncbi:hypothetical protein [Azohydromonas aeria]|uniref:hypothetical protein n=1 Tax=Azohydromonas aeria TaxID=2590212 RepID=UPI0012F74BF8|nr:hypothetical protein [Azohydromonas aeria]